ncbi:MAG: OmpA family protein [Myxococcales bacterium]|nr:OmpA family protein [Myxococcales bacterium]
MIERFLSIRGGRGHARRACWLPHCNGCRCEEREIHVAERSRARRRGRARQRWCTPASPAARPGEGVSGPGPRAPSHLARAAAHPGGRMPVMARGIARWALALGACGAMGSRGATASPWVAAEVPAALPISQPHMDSFDAGAMPAIGVYLGIGGHVAVGARLRAGALGNGPPPGDGVADPGRGGLTTGSAAVRLFAGALWIEAAGGGGVSGDAWVPTVEIGGGAELLSLGALRVGPSLRYLQVIGGDGGVDPGSAAIVLAGLELRLGGHQARARRAPAAIESIARVEPDADRVVDLDAGCALDLAAPGCALPDRDGDDIVDRDDACPDQAETVNGVDDADGCPDEGLFVVEQDRIVLEERILFDVNRARIKRRGRPVIAAIVRAWLAHGEWVHLVIEGHADVRGVPAYNVWLSTTRAQRVREAMIEAGVPADAIEAVGYGATRPRDPGHDLEAHARNRRVEFVIERGQRGP